MTRIDVPNSVGRRASGRFGRWLLILLLAVVVPVFAFLFWVLRRKFMTARQARVARPPRA